MKRVTCTLYSTWCIMICFVILILSLLLFIQSLSKLHLLVQPQFTPHSIYHLTSPHLPPPHFTSSPTTSLHLISHPPPHFTSSPTTSPHLPPTTSSPTHHLTSPHLPLHSFTPFLTLHSISLPPLHVPPPTSSLTHHLTSRSHLPPPTHICYLTSTSRMACVSIKPACDKLQPVFM